MMAIEDGWVLAEHVGSQAAARSAEGSGIDWDAALAAYSAVRPEHCRRVVLTALVPEDYRTIPLEEAARAPLLVR
jgi:salicylate hydroxylase